MSQPPEKYSVDGLEIEIYDTAVQNHSAIKGDVAFYLRLAREATGPVLEVASGTGRVACALAAEGMKVVGIDHSIPMLRKANAKCCAMPAHVRDNVTFVEGDMTEFNLDQTFALAIVPFRSFQMLRTVEAQRAALGCIHRHLHSRGRLVLHLFDPRFDRIVPGSASPADGTEIRHPENGNIISINIDDRNIDAYSQVVEETWHYTERDDNGNVVRTKEASLAIRWAYRWEMRYLLELCGFTVEAEYSDFKGGLPTYGRELILVAQRY